MSLLQVIIFGQVQEMLEVLSISLQTFMSTVNCCWITLVIELDVHTLSISYLNVDSVVGYL